MAPGYKRGHVAIELLRGYFILVQQERSLCHHITCGFSCSAPGEAAEAEAGLVVQYSVVVGERSHFAIQIENLSMIVVVGRTAPQKFALTHTFFSPVTCEAEATGTEAEDIMMCTLAK